MSLDLANLLRPEIASMIESGDFAGLRELSSEIHGADLDELFDSLDADLQVRFFEALDIDQQIVLFKYFDDDARFKIVEEVSRESRSTLLNELSPDDRAEFLEDLPQNLTERLIAELNPQERLYTLALLRCDENTAGRVMTPEFVRISPDMTVDEALTEVRARSNEVETIYIAYVVNPEGKLVGVASLRDLMKAKGNHLVDDMMTIDPIHVYVSTDQEEVAGIGARYDLLAVPVTTSDNRIVGIVTFDDIQDVRQEEVSEDILRMHGVGTATDDYFDASIRSKLIQRAAVIVSLFGAGILSVLLQDHYNYLVEQASVLAVFITLLNGSSGNCGTQMAGIVIRSQSIPEIDQKQMMRLLFREVVVGMLIAVIMAVLVITLVFVMHPSRKQLGNNELSHMAFAVGGAMFASLMSINLLGGLVPLIVKKLKMDPALTAGPFITTAADITTVVLYFTFAQLFLSG